MKLYDTLARYYDADVGHYTADIPFYLEMTRRSGDPVLDAMCGTGRVLVPLAEAGHTLTGVDVSQPMLDVACQRLEAAGTLQQVTLIQADLRSAKLPAQHFALAFVAVNSFMHLQRIKDQLAALATLRHTLVPDGVLLLDLFNPDPVELAREDNRLTLEREFELDDRPVTRYVASESNLATQVSRMTYIYESVDEQHRLTRHTAHISLRWFYRYELEHLLARAGFRLLSLYGSYDLDDYTANSEQLIALATPGREA